MVEGYSLYCDMENRVFSGSETTEARKNVFGEISSEQPFDDEDVGHSGKVDSWWLEP